MEIVRFNIKRYKNSVVQGFLCGDGQEWNCVHRNETDYILDGIQFTNKRYVFNECYIPKDSFHYKIMQKKNKASIYTYQIDNSLLDSTRDLFTYLYKKQELVALGLHHYGVFNVGKIIEVTDSSIKLHCYDPKMQECGIMKIELSRIRYFQIHTDYLDSLSIALQHRNQHFNMKIIRFNIKRYKNDGFVQGILCGDGQEWNCVHLNETDYFIDGFQFTNKRYIENENYLLEDTFHYKIMLHKKNSTKGLPKFYNKLLDSTQNLCNYLCTKIELVAIGLHRSDEIFVGRIIEVTESFIKLFSYDTEMKEDGLMKIKLSKIRFIQIHTDYLDSLSLMYSI